jgi:biopolymer transport protein ExbD
MLVFFLLVNSANPEVLESPKQITLPDSTVEDKPRETVVIFISPEQVTIQGEVVIGTDEILHMKDQNVIPIGDRLARVAQNVIGFKTQRAVESREVTILADKSVPFSVIKKVMSTCTSEGYGRIFLAVLQKASQMAYRDRAASAS